MSELTTRKKLIRAKYKATGKTQSEVVFLIDSKTELAMIKEMETGVWGTSLMDMLVTRDIKEVMYMIFGCPVIWGCPKFDVRPIESLNWEELQKVIKAQKHAIDVLAQRRVRLEHY